jgi:AcrR family transcriptional regulator
MFTEHVQSRAGQKDATRLKVLSHAERLFREQGYDATTIRAIAAAADVSVGTVMAVGDKAALLVEIYDSWIAEVHTARTARPVGSSDGTATGEVIALVTPFIEYFASDEGLAREYAAVLMRGSAQSVIFTELALALIGELVGVLERHGFAADQAQVGAGAIYFTYLGVLMASASGALSREAAEEQFRTSVTFTLTRSGEIR